MITTQPLVTKPPILKYFEIRRAPTWPEMLPGGLYIDPVFSANQRYNGIWTRDMESGESAAWAVHFLRGDVYRTNIGISFAVRPVRSGQK